jgi:hypothetical protein
MKRRILGKFARFVNIFMNMKKLALALCTAILAALGFSGCGPSAKAGKDKEPEQKEIDHRIIALYAVRNAMYESGLINDGEKPDTSRTGTNGDDRNEITNQNNESLNQCK